MHNEEVYREIVELLRYDDGTLIWDVDPNESGLGGVAGCAAGKVDSSGYRIIRYRRNGKRKYIAAHRIVYYMHYGSLPNIIDHIDRNRLNNKIENLRAVTGSQNARNRRKRAGKYMGVSDVGKGRYTAHITVMGCRYHLGTFDNEIDAAHAYDRKAKELGVSEHANLNF